MNTSESIECPLCLEAMDFDDVDFYPCPCRYQICRFCWAKIINEENGLCPACRKPYNSEHPASYKPRTEEEIKNRIRHSKKVCPKKKQLDGKEYLSEYRVLQKNLIFVVGLPMRMAEEIELLKGPDYFGKCGKVYKIVINQNQTFPGPQGTSCLSAYVTYFRNDDALRTLIDLKKLEIDGRAVKLSLGTTKYCSQFLRNRKCTKTDCMYLHEMGDPAASFTKEDMAAGRHTEYENQLIQEFVEVQSHQHQKASPSNLAVGISNKTAPSTSLSSSLGSNKPLTVSSTSSSTHRISASSSGSGNTLITPIGTDPNDASKLYIVTGDNSTGGSTVNNSSTDFDSSTLLNKSSSPDAYHHYQTNNNSLIQTQHPSLSTGPQFSPRCFAPPSSFNSSNNDHMISNIDSSHYQQQQQQSTLPIDSSSSSTIIDNADIDFDPIKISRQGLAELIANENRLKISNGPVIMRSGNSSVSQNSDYSGERLVQQLTHFSLLPSVTTPNSLSISPASSNGGCPITNTNVMNGLPGSHSTLLSTSNTNNSTPPPPPGFEFSTGHTHSNQPDGVMSDYLGTLMGAHEYYSPKCNNNSNNISNNGGHHSNTSPDIPVIPSHTMQHHHHQYNQYHSHQHHPTLGFQNSYATGTSGDFGDAGHHHALHHSLSHHQHHQLQHQHNPHRMNSSFHHSTTSNAAIPSSNMTWKNSNMHHQTNFCDPSISAAAAHYLSGNNADNNSILSSLHSTGMRPTIYNRSHSMNEGSGILRNTDWNGLFSNFNSGNSTNNNNNNNNNSTTPITHNVELSSSSQQNLSNCPRN